MEAEVDEIGRLLEVMPLIRISFDQRGLPQFIDYSTLLSELVRNNRRELGAESLATLLEYFAKEVPEWLSFRVSQFNPDKKTVHLKHNFNLSTWRQNKFAEKDALKKRMESIDAEKQTLFVVD